MSILEDRQTKRITDHGAVALSRLTSFINTEVDITELEVEVPQLGAIPDFVYTVPPALCQPIIEVGPD